MTGTGLGVDGGAIVVRPRLIVVAGPSGVGKTSVLTELRRRYPDFYFSVSVTTRPPRPGEVDGSHYHFVDNETFDKLVGDNQLLEHAEYAGNRYGTPRAPVEHALGQGKPAILEIEVQGARQVRIAWPSAFMVMIQPPSWNVLVERLTSRGTENPEIVERRLAAAKDELSASEEFDAVVVNADVRVAAEQLLTLIAQSPS
ncbi:MAG TPA: guanylate kinase [Pseudonocardiaceae bacterium]|nr:guanylate kinase [Pseudonocardiaceae bacterium]